MLRALVFLAAASALAQDPLASAFEARRVIVRIDMPGTNDGIDLYPEREQPLDLKSYQHRLKQFPLAVRNGDSIMVTKVKRKDKTIEFHLGGGGFGTFWDDKSSVTASSTPKSSRERQLEDQLRNEKDPGRRRSIESDLRYERNRRERRDSTARAEAAQANEIKQQRIADKRRDGGSRFNLKFESVAAAEAATPELVRRVLSEYVSFDVR